MTSGYKIRTTFVFLLFCILYGIILFNLYLVQITQSTFFARLGHKQYNVTLTTHPPRAPIYDRHGRTVALNKETLAAFIMPNQLEQPERLTAFLEKHFPYAIQRLEKNKEKSFMYVQRRLSEQQIALIKNSKIPDIHLLHEPNRMYPIPSAACVVGITDVDNNGLCGIELTCNTKLAGTPTTHQLQKDARSGHFYFAKETRVTGKTGTPVTLTIDGTLQFLAQEELNKAVQTFNAPEGAIIIINPANGHICAMAQYPDFDPKNRNTITAAHTKNKIVTEAYELGSVMKVCTALAALEEEVVTLDEEIDCHNKKTSYVEGRKINTVIAQGVVPFWDVIARSNNIGIAQVAKRLDDLLYDHYKRLGFGKKTGIAIAGEQSGFVNPPYNWSKQSIFSLSYGYEIRATLLQLARAFCIIANDGYAVEPQLLLKTPQGPSLQTSIDLPEQKPLYSKKAIANIKEILEKTTQEGSGRRAKIKGYTIMTKTGSADLFVDGAYNRDKSIFTCAGIVEKNDYKRVIVTFVKEPQRKRVYASTVAAPLFEKIAQKMLIHDKIL